MTAAERAADVVVVGAGIMGCALALRLAQAGAQVTVVEKAVPGAEASSAAAGILAPQMEAQGPGPGFELGLRSRGMYPRLAEELKDLTGIDVGYRPCGVLLTVFDEAGRHGLEAMAAWQTALGLRAELLGADEARALEPAMNPAAHGVLHFPDDAQVDNTLLVRALYVAAARAGVSFRTGWVRGLWTEGERVLGVDLEGAQVAAGAVVLAAGSWSGLVHGAGVGPAVVRPVRGQMLELQAKVPLLSRIVFSFHKGYVVPRVDGRVIVGSTMEEVGFEKEVTAGGLAAILGVALQLCPELAGAPVTRTWAGLRPGTRDHLPLLGEGPLRGLFFATGHFRNGILLAPITARLVAERVLGQPTAVDLAPFRYDRPGLGAAGPRHR